MTCGSRSHLTYLLSHHTMSPPSSHSILKTYCTWSAAWKHTPSGSPQEEDLPWAACSVQSAPKSISGFLQSSVPGSAWRAQPSKASSVHPGQLGRGDGMLIAQLPARSQVAWQTLLGMPTTVSARDHARQSDPQAPLSGAGAGQHRLASCPRNASRSHP